LGRHRSQLVPSELSVAGKLPFIGIAAGDTPGSDAYLCNIEILEKVQNTKHHVCYLEAIEMSCHGRALLVEIIDSRTPATGCDLPMPIKVASRYGDRNIGARTQKSGISERNAEVERCGVR
jgi:hypothetical protein